MDNPTDSNDVNATSPTPVVPMAGDTAAPAPTMGGDAPAADAPAAPAPTMGGDAPVADVPAPMAGDTAAPAAPAPTMGGDAPAAPAEDAGTSDGTGGTTA